jgi:hypothetical protein
MHLAVGRSMTNKQDNRSTERLQGAATDWTETLGGGGGTSALGAQADGTARSQRDQAV